MQTNAHTEPNQDYDYYYNQDSAQINDYYSQMPCNPSESYKPLNQTSPNYNSNSTGNQYYEINNNQQNQSQNMTYDNSVVHQQPNEYSHHSENLTAQAQNYEYQNQYYGEQPHYGDQPRYFQETYPLNSTAYCNFNQYYKNDVHYELKPDAYKIHEDQNLIEKDLISKVNAQELDENINRKYSHSTLEDMSKNFNNLDLNQTDDKEPK